MNALIFPGQGCQQEGMGRELYEHYAKAREYFDQADNLLGYSITDVMFHGSELDLMQTKYTQPAVYLYSTILALVQNDIRPDVVAGHSLGEFSALVVSGVLSFRDGLNLVLNRALIAQKVCEKSPTAMGAVIGLDDQYVEHRLAELSEQSGEPIYFANYNGPGQVVITGSKAGIKLACTAFNNEGAKKAVRLSISGSFHSPFMEQARIELGHIIEQTPFNVPRCPIVQCVDAKANTDPELIKQNLIHHITHPVLWTQMVRQMQAMGVSHYWESGPDDTLQKIVARMCPDNFVGSLLDTPFYQPIRPVTIEE